MDYKISVSQFFDLWLFSISSSGNVLTENNADGGLLEMWWMRQSWGFGAERNPIKQCIIKPHDEMWRPFLMVAAVMR